MATKGPPVLYALICCLLINTADSGHSLQYYHTAVSSPGHGLPLYVSVGYVDGIQITHYSSDTGQTVPVAPWMKKLDPDYWEEETRNGKHAEAICKHNVKIAMHRFNQTGGFHSFQEMYGCELRDDGSTRGYWQYGYDWKDFLALDTERWVYYPLTEQAQLSAQKWNEPEQRSGKRAKDYLETECIDWLKKYLEYGKEELERRVRPEVKVSSNRSGSTMKLHCQVFGFYPWDVDVNLKKNGMDIPSDEAKHVLPNSDGTYQLRASVEVTPEDGASYTCHVDHSSLKETLIAMWVFHPKTDGVNAVMIVPVIIGFVITLTLLTGVVTVRWKRNFSEGKNRKPHIYSRTISDIIWSDPEYIGNGFHKKTSADERSKRCH